MRRPIRVASSACRSSCFHPRRRGRGGVVRPRRAVDGLRPDYITCTYGAGLDAAEDAGNRRRGSSAVRLPGGLASDLRRLDGRRAAIYLGDVAWRRSRTSWPCGATAAGRVRVQAGGRRPAYANELVALFARSFPRSAWPWPGGIPKPTRSTQPRGRYGQPASQSRRRGRRRDHAVVLRQRGLLAIPRSLPATRDPRANRAWHFAGDQPVADPADFLAVRRGSPANSAGLALASASVEDQFACGVEFATRQVQELVEQGCPACTSTCSTSRRPPRAVLGAISLPCAAR